MRGARARLGQRRELCTVRRARARCEGRGHGGKGAGTVASRIAATTLVQNYSYDLTTPTDVAFVSPAKHVRSPGPDRYCWFGHVLRCLWSRLGQPRPLTPVREDGASHSLFFAGLLFLGGLLLAVEYKL